MGESERRFFSSATSRASGNVLSEQREGLARRAAKLVDRLIGIAHGKDVGLGPGKQRENLDLRKIRILKFIDQQKAGAAAFFLEQGGIVLQQMIGLRDHVAEGAQVFLAQHALPRWRRRGRSPATLEDFRVFQFLLLL